MLPRQRITAAIRSRGSLKTSSEVASSIPSKTSIASLQLQTRNYSATQPAKFIRIPKDLVGNLSSAVETAKNTIFDLMARNMNEKDVKKFVDHWKNQSPDGTNSIDTSNLTPTLQKVPQQDIAPKVPATTQSKRIPTKEEIDELFKKQYDCELYHPQLGELVADYGYKRIYQTSVNALAKTPVWKKQRILRPERATLIAEDKIRKKITSQLPGVITLYQNQTTKEIGIIDGQHRVGALMILAQRGYWNPNEKNVVLEVFSTSTEDDVSVLFRVINAAEPVRLIDLPDNETFEADAEAEEEEEVIITTVTKTPNAEPSSKLIEPKVEVITERAEPKVDVNTKTRVNQVSEEQQPPVTTPVSTTTAPEPVIVATAVDSILPKDSFKDKVTEDLVATPSIPVSDSVDTSSTKENPSQAPAPATSSNTIEETTSTSQKSSKKSTKKLNNDQIITIITEGVTALASQYGEMFKPTSRCKIPHVNIDVLRDELFTSNFLLVRHIQTTDQLLEALKEVNEELHQQYQTIAQNESNPSYTKSFQTALKKSQKFHFYLGMDKQWIYSPPTTSK
eukprot:gene4715-5052_t